MYASQGACVRARVLVCVVSSVLSVFLVTLGFFFAFFLMNVFMNLSCGSFFESLRGSANHEIHHSTNMKGGFYL